MTATRQTGMPFAQALQQTAQNVCLHRTFLRSALPCDVICRVNKTWLYPAKKSAVRAFRTFRISVICALSDGRKYPLFSAKSLD